MILNWSGWPEISTKTTVSITLEFVASWPFHLIHLVTLLPPPGKIVFNNVYTISKGAPNAAGPIKTDTFLLRLSVLKQKSQHLVPN